MKAVWMKVVVLGLLMTGSLAWADAGVKDAVELGKGKAIAMSPDGKTIVTAGMTIELWDAATGKAAGKLDYKGQAIERALFSADGALLAVGGMFNPKVTVYEVKSGKVSVEIDGKAPTLPIGFSPDGKSVVTRGLQGIDVRNLSDGAVSKSIKLAGNFESFVLTPDGKEVITIGKFDGKVSAWDLSTGQQSARQFKQDAKTTPALGGKVAIIGTEHLAVLNFSGQAVFFFNLQSGAFEHKIADVSLQQLGSTPDGQTLAYGTWYTQADNFVIVADASGKPSTKIGPFPKSKVYAAALISADAKTLVALPNGGLEPALLWQLK